MFETILLIPNEKHGSGVGRLIFVFDVDIDNKNEKKKSFDRVRDSIFVVKKGEEGAQVEIENFSKMPARDRVSDWSSVYQGLNFSTQNPPS